MTENSPPESSALLGGPARDSDFIEVRETLRNSGYHETEACQRLGLDTIHEFVSLDHGRSGSADIHDALDLMIRLLLDAEPIESRRVETFIPESALQAMLRLGMLVPVAGAGDSYVATILLPPIRGLYVASDLEVPANNPDPDGSRRPDYVFSAMTSLTGTFL